MRSNLGVAMIVMALACSAACDRGSDRARDPLGNESPFSIAGSWSTSATEIMDTCGFDPPQSQSPLWIDEAGDGVIFNFVDPSGFCEQSVRERVGDYVMLHRTDVLQAGCGSVLVQSAITYRFTPSGFSGESIHFYSNLGGFCSNLPCDYRLSIAGFRCNGCWHGCIETLGERAPIPTPPTGALPRGLAPS